MVDLAALRTPKGPLSLQEQKDIEGLEKEQTNLQLLNKAIATKNITLVKRLLEQDESISQTAFIGSSPLEQLAQRWKIDEGDDSGALSSIATLLLAAGAKSDYDKDFRGSWTEQQKQAFKMFMEKAKSKIKRDFIQTTKETDHYYRFLKQDNKSLCCAVYDIYPQKVREFLEAGANPDTRIKQYDNGNAIEIFATIWETCRKEVNFDQLEPALLDIGKLLLDAKAKSNDMFANGKPEWCKYIRFDILLAKSEKRNILLGTIKPVISSFLPTTSSAPSVTLPPIVPQSPVVVVKEQKLVLEEKKSVLSPLWAPVGPFSDQEKRNVDG